MMRIGFGYDVHKLVNNRELFLCGVNIPHNKGLLGHSDADVAIHAIIDALLGALALGDIGQHFPDSDMKYKDISSSILLKETFLLISNKGFIINNIDITICAEKPKLKPFIYQMRKNIANILNCEIDFISIKATTEENLGVTGDEKGMSAHCVALLKDKNL
jgi:2-C-methyl-D-erythritol 2,4-cyclodiphosphate synthase